MVSTKEDLVLIVLSKRKKRRFWIHHFLQIRDREGELHLSVEELKWYHGQFRMHFRMSVRQFAQFNLRLVCQTTLSAERRR